METKPSCFYSVIFITNLADTKLIHACISNNRKAQFELYRKYYAFVSGICLRYLKEEAVARETVNDIFLKLFTKITTFNAAEASFTTWLRTIAVRTCLDKMKPGAFEHRTLPLDTETVTDELPTEGVITESILQVLHTLPQRQSVIFNLFIVEGYTHEEIGKMLHISAGNSRWYLNDAKQRVRKVLSGTGYKIK